MDTQDYIEKLEAALIDVLDGSAAWYEIRDNTGISEERAKEISDFYHSEVQKRYREKHGI